MISIIVPARNEEKNIERLFESLEKNNYDDYDVIVVDGGSEDRTVEIAERYGATVIEGPQEGTAVARNVGWRAAEGDIIYFLDADWFLGENTLEKIAEGFEEQGADIVDVENRHYKPNWVSKAVSAENKFGSKNSRAKILEQVKSKIESFV